MWGRVRCQPLGLHFRFQCVFPLLPGCLRPDVALPSVLLAVELLALLADHQALAPQLCSRSGKGQRGHRDRLGSEGSCTHGGL